MNTSSVLPLPRPAASPARTEPSLPAPQPSRVPAPSAALSDPLSASADPGSDQRLLAERQNRAHGLRADAQALALEEQRKKRFTLTPEERATKKKETLDRVEHLYTDPAAFDQYRDPARGRGALPIASHDAERLRYVAANRAYFSALDEQVFPGQVISGLHAEAARLRYLTQHGLPLDLPEQALFGEIQKDVQTKRAREADEKRLLGMVVSSSFESVDSGKRKSTPELLAEWQKEIPAERLQGLDQRLLIERIDGLRQRVEPHAARGNEVLTILGQFTGSTTGNVREADYARVNQLADSLTDLPPEQLDAALQLVAITAEARGLGSGKKFVEKLGESFGRGLTDLTRKPTLALQETDLITRRDALASGGLFLVDEKGQLVMDSMQTGSIVLGSSPMPEGWRRGNDEDRARSLAFLDRSLKQVDIKRRLGAFSDGVIDPVKASKTGALGLLEEGAYGSARSLPMSLVAAIPTVGPVLTVSALYGSEYERMRLQYRDMDPRAVAGSAAISAALMAPIELVQSKAFVGKLPGTAALLNRMSDIKLSLPVRIGGAVAGNAVEQFTQETAQQTTSIIVDGVAASLRQDMPEFDAGAAFRGMAEGSAGTFFTLLPMILIGSGASSVREIQRGAAFTSDQFTLRASGFSEAKAAEIAAEVDPAKREALIRAGWAGRSDADIRSGLQLLQAKLDESSPPQIKPVFDDRARDQYGNPVRQFSLTLGNGSTYTARTIGEADAALRSEANHGARQERRVPAEVGHAIRELAQDESTRTLGPTPTAKDLRTILQTLSPKTAAQIEISQRSGFHGKEYTFTDPKRGAIYLVENEDGTFHVNSLNSKKYGTEIYQSIYAWAHNNGQVIVEDDIMFPDGVYRRTSHMLSSALRFATTRHMTVGKESGIADQWIFNDDSKAATDHNIGLLALKEAEIVQGRLKELAGIHYDVETQSFYDGDHRIPDEEVEAYIRSRIGEVDRGIPRRIGPATLRRTLAALAAQRAGTTGGLRLVGENARAPTVLTGAYYSTNPRRKSGDLREGSSAPGGKPESVSRGPGSESGGSANGVNQSLSESGESRGDSNPLTHVENVLKFEDAGEADTATQAGIDVLREAYRRDGVFEENLSGLVGKSPARGSRHSNAESEALEFITGFERLTGKKIVFFDLKDFPIPPYTGLVLDESPNNIYIHSRAPRNVLSLVGHEWSHTLKTDHPELYRRLQNELIPYVDSWKARAREAGGAFYPRNRRSEELTGNIVGDAIGHPDFMKHLSEKNRPLFQQVLASVKAWFNKLRGKALGSEWGTESFLRNLDEVHGIIMRTMEESVTAKPKERESQ